MPKIVGYTRGMVLCQKMRDFCDDPRMPRFDKYRPYLNWFVSCPVKELKTILNDVRTAEEMSDICDILVRHRKFLDSNLIERVWKTQVECDLTTRGFSAFGEAIRAKIVASCGAILGTRKSFEVLDWYMGCLERNGKQTSGDYARVKEESEKVKKELSIEKHNQRIRNIRNANKTREDIENLKAKIAQLEKLPELRIYQRIVDKNYGDMIENLKTTLDLLLQRHPDSMEILETKLEVLRFAENLQNYLTNATTQLERCRANLPPNSSVEEFPSVQFREKYARLTNENGLPNFLENL
ncbi:unnamed protein product [Caenorhabditis angaria]|uniref:Uncharacterized protein n=1 Tax=Caenorhabditis angaria TaxID=860376 RepID=A0A9P1N0E1_9PELO|nr:unnamed protein product [Caenorhabditis angaria]